MQDANDIHPVFLSLAIEDNMAPLREMAEAGGISSQLCPRPEIRPSVCFDVHFANKGMRVVFETVVLAFFEMWAEGDVGVLLHDALCCNTL